MSKTYDDRTSDQLFYLIIEEFTGKKRTDVILEADSPCSEELIKRIPEVLEKLKSNEPVQYILGKAHFFDLTFNVDQNVLIPRPETEELVQLILAKHGVEKQVVLDIGTGSGIIPVTLKKHRPKWQVLACDVSEGALRVATSNSEQILGEGGVEFYREDILNPVRNYDPQLDVIVSNPPYVLESDKRTMEPNVLNHEPHLALFVEDDDPLLFYREIANYAERNLKKGGWIYFEVHEDYASDVEQLLTLDNYKSYIINDLQGKSRMVSAEKTN